MIDIEKGLLYAVIAAVVIAAIVIAGAVLRPILFPVAVANNSVNMAYEIADDTLTGKNAIYNYEWFKQQEADIRRCVENEFIAQEEYAAYVAALPTDAAGWSDFQQREEASLRSSLSALKKITNKAIEDYNAKAGMANRNIFNDNLPSNITRAFYAGFQLMD